MIRKGSEEFLSAKIVVIDHGEIKEISKHEELLEKPDFVYASLYETQLK